MRYWCTSNTSNRHTVDIVAVVAVARPALAALASVAAGRVAALGVHVARVGLSTFVDIFTGTILGEAATQG